jgi:hypothetical protein
MSAVTPPPVDAHDAAWFRDTVAKDLTAHVGWHPVDTHGAPDQASAALIGVFGRFCEIVAQHLNQVPNKNFLAFLDLLGNSRLPPQPARVPLTFTLAAGSPSDAIVPAGTQVAAPALPGERQPVIFETEREVAVIPATVQTLLAVDAERDLLGVHAALVARAADAQVRLFAGNRLGEHILYVGTDMLFYPEIDRLTLQVFLSFDAPPGQPVVDRELQWEVWDGLIWRPIAVAGDSTSGLQRTGIVEFVNLTAAPPLALQVGAAGDGIPVSPWLRARLLTPLRAGAVFGDGSIRSLPEPELSHITASVALNGSDLPPEAACWNSQVLDIGAPFLPFGERPRPGDIFYLGSKAFGAHGATLTLDVMLVNPAPDTPPPVTTPAITPAQASPDLFLEWEVWTDLGWLRLATSTVASSTPDAALSFNDDAHAFTRSRAVTFQLPFRGVGRLNVIVPTSINGIETHWLRVKITGGNYGGEARYVPDATATGGFKLEPTTLAPPIIKTIRLARQLTTPLAFAELWAFNNFEFTLISRTRGGLAFSPLSAQPPTLYAALALPPERTVFPRRTVSLYHAVAPTQYATRAAPLGPDLSIQSGAVGEQTLHHFTLTNAGTAVASFHVELIPGALHYFTSLSDATLAAGESVEVIITVLVPLDFPPGAFRDRCSLQVRDAVDGSLFSVTLETRIGDVAPHQRNVRWEYWNGGDWKTLAVADGTEQFTHSGLIEFFGPEDLTRAEHFGTHGYWLRALFDADDAPNEPRLRAFLPNTMFAAQTATVRNELLGSSDATENQRFRVARAPVLAGQQLEVRETGPLSASDLDALEAAHGTSGVTPAVGTRGNEIWVRWIEVADLYASGPQDRHYILDHITGEVTFGDGVRGRIPPRGAGNVRMARYQTGGGSAGNRAAGTIAQLKTTVPFLAQVTSLEAAAGGIAAESSVALIARAPRTLRHGGRAVTAEDYEDLARLASPEVARTKCVSARRLQDDPLGNTPAEGSVSMIVVPASADARPLPSVELLARVEQFLRTRQPATADVAAVGPLYVRVDVRVEVALASLEGANQVGLAIRTQLAAFLHPLTGGRDGTGWDFGREPQLSDLHAVVSDVADVDHIRKLSMRQVEDVSGAKDAGRFLVYSGRHQVVLTFTRSE